MARWLGIQMEHDVYYWLDAIARDGGTVAVGGQRVVITSLSVDRNGIDPQRGSMRIDYFIVRRA